MSKCLIKVKTKLAEAKKEYNQFILDEMLGEIDDIRKKSRTKDGFRRKLDAYIKETGEEKIINEYNAAVQASKYAEIDRTINNAPNKAEGLLSLIRGSNYAYEGAGVNLENIQASRVNKYMAILEQSFSEEELRILGSKALDRDIIKYISSNGKEGNPAVKKFAETFKKLGLYLHEDKVKTGIMENFLADRVFNQKNLYDVKKMQYMGKDAWVDLTHSKLDIEKTFPYLETKEEQVKYLGDVFDNLIKKSEEMQANDFSKLPKERIKGQIIKKYSKQRQLHYTPEGLADMFEQFADRSLIESVISEATRVSKDIASYEVFGPAGSNGFASTVQRTMKGMQKELKSLDPKSPEWAKLHKEIEDIQLLRDGKKKFTPGFNAYMKEFYSSSFDGSNNPSILEDVRAITAASSLGMTMISALTDFAFAISKLNMATDGGFLKNTGNQIFEAFKMIPASNRKNVAVKFGIALDSQMGNILRGQNATGAISKGVTKVSYLFNKINPLAAQAQVNRVAATNLLSMEFADWTLKSSLNDLPAEAKTGLLKAGITDNDLTALRQMRRQIQDDVYAIDSVSTDMIPEDIALESIKAHKSNNPNFVPKNAAEYRAHLEKRLDAYFTEFANDAAPKPGMKEKVILSMGSEKGSMSREAWDTLNMFKSFSVKQANIMHKIWASNPTMAGRAKHFSGLAVGLMTTAYMAESLYAIANNQTPPDPTNPETMKRVALRSGLGYLFADAMLGKDDWATTFVAGPVVSKTLGPDGVLGNLKKGNVQGLTNMIPFQNYLPLKMSLEYTIADDWREINRPGHKRRMEQRRKEQEGLLWRPQKIIE